MNAHQEQDAGPARLPVQGGEVAWALRLALVAHDQATHAVARSLGLNTTDLAALDHLLHGDGLGPAELAARLGIRSASATVLVDRLHAAGHVRRLPHPHDRRRQLVHVTDHAVQELTGTLQPLIDAIDAAAAPLAPDEQAVVIRFLESAAQKVREAMPR